MQKLVLVFFSLAMGWKSPDFTANYQNEKREIRQVQKKDLVGEFSRKDLEQKPFSRWFKRGYKKYKPKKKALKIIKENISDYEIVYLMGAWCIDSRREIPKLYRLLDEAGYDTSKISSFAVDGYKETPGELENELEVKRVPTIIFYKNGKEVNRFVEFPVESLEEDIAAIVSQQNYKDSYSEFFKKR